MSSSKGYVCGGCLQCCKIVTIDLEQAKPNYVLIQGIIYQANGAVMANAAIVAYQLIKQGTQVLKKYVTMTYSSEDGEYGIVIPRDADYEIICYPQ